MVAALLGASGEGVISPLLPHADNASAAATNSPAVTEPFICEVSVAGWGASAAVLQSTFHFHGETVIPRSRIDPTQAFVDISESLHENVFNIAATKTAVTQRSAAMRAQTDAAIRPTSANIAPRPAASAVEPAK